MTQPEIRYTALPVGPHLSLYHTGPSLDLGPLPSFFYLALSGPDSLCLDPFNQPVQFLHGQKIRVFSLTLPGHENNLPATQALHVWAEEFAKGLDPIGTFLDQALEAISFSIREKLADPARLAVGGLSRGGFAAAHLAAREKRFQTLLAFAPATRLSRAREFTALQDQPLIHSYNLVRLAEPLSNRHVRIYIGNCDTRVGTRSCVDFALALSETAYEKNIRSPQIELILSPSVGQMGHGTPPEIFRQGADWLATRLLAGGPK